MPQFYILERHQQGRLLLSPLGDLDFDSCPTLSRRLKPLCRLQPVPPVELDMSGVARVDAAGLALLRALQDQFRTHGGELAITGMPEASRHPRELGRRAG